MNWQPAKPILLLAALLSAASCASRNPRSIVNEVEEGNISTQSVLDLARNSYLKGCVDGKNVFAPHLKESSFEKCVKHAKEHEAEILYILEQSAPK